MPPKGRQPEQTNPFLLTPIVGSGEDRIQSARLFGGKWDPVRSGKVVGMFLEPEAKPLGCMNEEDPAFVSVAKPGTEASRNVKAPLLGGVDGRINGKADGLDRVGKDDQLLKVRRSV